MCRVFSIVVLAVVALTSVASGQTGTFLDRHSPLDVRVADYNVNWDSIFPDDDPDNHPWRAFNKVAEFRRLIAAINPDIMCLQEINSARDPQDVADIFDETIPLAGGQWHAAIGYDCVIVSRYPLSMIAEQTDPPGYNPQSLSLVDLPNELFASDLYVMNEHYKCCSGGDNEAKRQQQSDALANWMRDAKAVGEFIDLPAGTPMIVTGDLNIVEGPGPLDTLLTGDISDEGTYGGDSPPDWDDSDNTDSWPLHNAIGPDDYTWRNDGGGYDPGRLDYMIFTDSVAASQHKFILNTTIMTQAELDATGLQEYDMVLDPPGRFDHLPIVMDLRLVLAVQPDGDVSLDASVDGRDVAWFVDLAAAGALADPLRVAHGDFDGSGLIDTGDLPAFVGAMLAGG
ncbi:MAG: endonuclease/exonuclease/phosphatase family protein [Planctomycetota bacterium]